MAARGCSLTVNVIMSHNKLSQSSFMVIFMDDINKSGLSYWVKRVHDAVTG